MPNTEPPKAVAPWKLLFRSVRGAAHERNGQPCQDSCLVRLTGARPVLGYPGPQGSVLLLACADGAGSARFAEIGSALACRAVIQLVRQDLDEGLNVSDIERDTALSWLIRLRSQLERQAALLQAPLGQLACTLLLAVVSEEAAVFVQIGDGAMVFLEPAGVPASPGGEEYRLAFWPQTGEYANTTHFVTDTDFDANLVFELRQARIDELALFSDGLQMLALHFASRSVHQPFFRPMFERLRTSTPGEQLPEALRRFLTSSAVNARSDDDKTLILATRVSSSAATHAV